MPIFGHRGHGWSTHCEVTYAGVRVPVENTLGEPGDGFRIAQKRLGPGRIHHVMRWLGQMQRAFELLCTRALEREAFGSRLADKQTIQNWIADSAADIHACRLMTLDAAHKIDGGDEARVEISLIKFVAARVLNEVIDRAIQVHGGLGLTDRTPLAAMYDAGARRAHLRRARTRCTAWSSAGASSRSSRTAGRGGSGRHEPRGHAGRAPDRASPRRATSRSSSSRCPEPGPGEVLVRILWTSVDPYQRGRMSTARSYAKPVEIGEVMTAQALGEVVESNDGRFAAGRPRRRAARLAGLRRRARRDAAHGAAGPRPADARAARGRRAPA